jgi:outer membrane usher protein FimD/PapC
LSFLSYAQSSDIVIVAVTLNGQSKGEYYVHLTEDRDILVRVADIRVIGIENPEGLVTEIDREPHISLRSMRGLQFVFNEKKLIVDITVDPSLLPRKVIDFLPGRQPKVYYPRDTSAFLNYRLDYYAGDSFDFNSVNVTNEVGFRTGDILFFSDGFYTKKSDDEKFVRLMTNITYDYRGGLQRFIAGDFIASSGDLGSTLNMGGISFSKIYRMDPYLIKNPMLNVSGFVTLPSEVEVYLNGMRIRTERLPPGGFDLRNIDYYGGAGLLEVVIRDPFGKEERLNFPFYFSDFLLKKGLHEYSYNLGAIREDFANESNEYGDVAFAAFHRYGFSDKLTLGYHAEALKDFCNFGPQASYLIRDKGVISVSLSKSIGSGGKDGAAGILGYTYQGKKFNTRFFIAGYTENHARISYDITDEKPQFHASAGLGYATERFGSFSVDFLNLKRFQGEDKKEFVASYSKSLSGSSTVFATFRNTNEERSSNEFFVGINYYPGRNHTISASYRGDEDSHQEVLQVSKNIPVGEGISYRASIERTDNGGDNFTSLNPSVQYNAKHGIIAAETKVDFDRDGRTTESYRLSAAGSIAYVGRTIGLSRPVIDSFGLVKVGDLKDVKVFHNNEEIGSTNSSGKVFVPNLSAFLNNQISISDNDIPMDYTIAEVVKYVSPPLRSGSFIPFEVVKFQAITGKLKIRIKGEPRPAEFCEVIMRVDGQEMIFPTGKGGEFYFENVKPGSYKTLLKYVGKECIFDMIIPESNDMIIDLKEVICDSGT